VRRLPVVRGGAAIGGWQGCGEWSLLLSYTRSIHIFDDHDNGMGLRLVMDIILNRRTQDKTRNFKHSFMGSYEKTDFLKRIDGAADRQATEIL
jgi:hypothetical protein